MESELIEKIKEVNDKCLLKLNRKIIFGYKFSINKKLIIFLDNNVTETFCSIEEFISVYNVRYKLHKLVFKKHINIKESSELYVDVNEVPIKEIISSIEIFFEEIFKNRQKYNNIILIENLFKPIEKQIKIEQIAYIKNYINDYLFKKYISSSYMKSVFDIVDSRIDLI
jgi:signal recognition particle receptor subunit beta